MCFCLGVRLALAGTKSVELLGCNEVGNKYVMGRGMMVNRVLGFVEFSTAVSLCVLGADVR